MLKHKIQAESNTAEGESTTCLGTCVRKSMNVKVLQPLWPGRLEKKSSILMKFSLLEIRM